MTIGRLAASAVAAALMAAGLAVAAATPASANEVWNQGIGRASADAGCPTNTAAESAAGWSQWAPSWAQWPGNGVGGWVCERSVTWALSSSPYPAGIGCVAYGTGEWANFAGNWFLPAGSDAYTESDCATGTINGFFTDYAVYAPPGYDALTLCRLLAPATVSVDDSFTAEYVYECLPY